MIQIYIPREWDQSDADESSTFPKLNQGRGKSAVTYYESALYVVGGFNNAIKEGRAI